MSSFPIPQSIVKAIIGLPAIRPAADPDFEDRLQVLMMEVRREVFTDYAAAVAIKELARRACLDWLVQDIEQTFADEIEHCANLLTIKEAEVVHIPSLTEQTVTPLAQIGDGLSDEAIHEVIETVEDAHDSFAVGLIRAGILLLAKRVTTPHGKWLPWLNVFSKTHGHSQTSLLRYMQVTRLLLARLEDGRGRRHVIDHDGQKTGLIALHQDIVQKRKQIDTSYLFTEAFGNAVKAIYGRQSLRALMRELGTAELAATKEEQDENTPAKVPTIQLPSSEVYRQSFFANLETTLQAVDRPDLTGLSETDRERAYEQLLFAARKLEAVTPNAAQIRRRLGL
jgi:hypothetical protein